jgi:hypothetical protein
VVKTYLDELQSWLTLGYGFSGNAEQAQAFYAALPSAEQAIFARQVYFAELRAGGLEYNDVDGPRKGSYLRGRNAIAALFPSTDVAGNPIRYDGDITLFGGAGVKTLFGGDIQMLTPGGQCSASKARRRRPRRGHHPGLGQHSAVLAGQHSAGAEPDHDHLRRLDSAGRPRATSTPVAVRKPPWSTPRPNASMTLGQRDPVAIGAEHRRGYRHTQPDCRSAPGDIDLIAPLGTIDAGEAGFVSRATSTSPR